MPAGAAIPAAIGLAGAGASAVGAHRARQQQQQQFKQQQRQSGLDRSDLQQFQNLVSGLFGLPFQQQVTGKFGPGAYGGGIDTALGVGSASQGGSALGGAVGGGPLGGLLFGPRTSTTRTSGGTTTDMLTAPEIAEQFKPDISNLQQVLRGRLSEGGALPAGFAETRAQDINRAFAGPEAAERNRAARLGGGLGPVSAAGRERAGALARLPVELEEMRRSRETEDIGLSERLAQTFGLGQRQRGTTRTSGLTEATGPADIGSILSVLGLLAPQPRPIVQPPPAGPSPLASGIGAGANIFSSLYPLFGGGGGIGGGVPGAATPPLGDLMRAGVFPG